MGHTFIIHQKLFMQQIDAQLCGRVEEERSNKYKEENIERVQHIDHNLIKHLIKLLFPHDDIIFIHINTVVLKRVDHLFVRSN